MLAQIDVNILTELIKNSPIAVAIILTVVLFLKRQKEQGAECSETLKQVIDLHTKTSQAIVDSIEHLSDRIDRNIDGRRVPELKAVP